MVEVVAVLVLLREVVVVVDWLEEVPGMELVSGFAEERLFSLDVANNHQQSTNSGRLWFNEHGEYSTNFSQWVAKFATNIWQFVCWLSLFSGEWYPVRAHFFSVLYCFYLSVCLRTLRSQHDQGGGIFDPNNRQAGGSERNTCGTLRFQKRGEMCSKSIGNGWNNPCTLSDLYGKWDDVQRSLDGWTTLFLDKIPPTCLLDHLGQSHLFDDQLITWLKFW